MPIAKQKSGIGINFIHDKIGLHKILSFGASYAYRFKLANKNVLALGLGARVENARADWSEANGEVNGADQLFQADSKTTFNVGPGVYFNNRNLYLGLSIPRLLRNSLYNDKDKFGGDVNTYYLQGGYIARLSRHVELHPNAQIRYNPHAPFDFDANLNLWLYDLFMIGANYRYEDSINGLLGLKLRNGLQFGFAMDFTLSDLKQATTGSYEIFVGYTFPCEDCAIQSLRYF
jgi:type IX secretion system PorP/SprF family membrane protein